MLNVDPSAQSESEGLISSRSIDLLDRDKSLNGDDDYNDNDKDDEDYNDNDDED